MARVLTMQSFPCCGWWNRSGNFFALGMEKTSLLTRIRLSSSPPLWIPVIEGALVFIKMQISLEEVMHSGFPSFTPHLELAYCSSFFWELAVTQRSIERARARWMREAIVDRIYWLIRRGQKPESWPSALFPNCSLGGIIYHPLKAIQKQQDPGEVTQW